MFSFFISTFLFKLEQYKKIALFVHVQPDFDAFASAFGLKRWLKDNYPETVVYLMIPPETFKDNEKFLFDHQEPLPSLDDLKDALGIVVDTSNPERILTQNHVHCKELVIIDHHPKESSFAHLELIEPTYPATAHILSEIFFHLEETQNKKFAEDIAQYFYAGIMTDTNNFMSFSMIPSTYNVLAKLISKGINRESIHNFIFVKPIKHKLFNNEVLRMANLTRNGLIYSIVTPSVMKEYGIREFPNIVNMLENVKGVGVWTVLFYDYEINKWKCSIRSKDIAINSLAKLFGGGGHKTMAAILFKKKYEYFKFLVVLDEYISKRGLKDATLEDRSFSFLFMFFRFIRVHKRLLKKL